MTVEEDQAELTLIKAEIVRRLQGGAVDEYSVSGQGHGRNVRKATLEWLSMRRDELSARVAASTEGGTFNYAQRGDF